MELITRSTSFKGSLELIRYEILTLYATKEPKVLDKIGIGSVMVGATNSDSARISFLGGTEGGLARELDRGSRCSQGLLKCPLNRARWSPIT
jgi:hypothetical protein